MGCGRIGFDETGNHDASLAPDAPPGALVPQPVADTYLCQTGCGQQINYAFGGAAELNTSLIEIVLVQFDLTGLPPQVVQRATLRLHGIGGSLGSVMQLELYRVTESWTESLATWELRSAITPWTTMGGTYLPAAYATTLVYSTADYLEIDLTSLTNEWLQAVPNYGVAIVPYNAPADDQMQFASREHGQPELKPTLIVEP